MGKYYHNMIDIVTARNSIKFKGALLIYWWRYFHTENSQKAGSLPRYVDQKRRVCKQLKCQKNKKKNDRKKKNLEKN